MNAAELTTVCSTVVTLAGIVVGYLKLRLEQRKTNVHVSAVSDKVEVVRQDVNSNLTTAQNRNEQLTAQLTASGIAVPETPK